MKPQSIVFLCLLLVITLASRAQRFQTITISGEKVLLEEAVDSTLIFLFETKEQAQITLNNGTKFTAGINYSILADAMQTLTRRGNQTIDPMQVECVEVAGLTFVFKPAEGYLEVLSLGKYPIYRKRKILVSAVPLVRGPYGTKDYTSSIDQASYVITGPRGEFYLTNNTGQEIEVTLRYNEYFLIGKGEGLVKITNQRQLLRGFPDHRHDLRHFFHDEGVEFENPGYLIKLGRFLDELP